MFNQLRLHGNIRRRKAETIEERMWKEASAEEHQSTNKETCYDSRPEEQSKHASKKQKQKVKISDQCKKPAA